MARFQPGTSGNPGGRPRVDAASRDSARRSADAAVLELLRLARDQRASWAQRRRACLDLVRLAYGRQGICPAAAELLAGLRPMAAPPPPAPPQPPENRQLAALSRLFVRPP